MIIQIDQLHIIVTFNEIMPHPLPSTHYPVHKRLLCGRTKPTGRNDDGVLEHISKLPEELKLEILRRLSLDQLLDMKPSLPLLRLVLPVPPATEFEPWLAKF